MHKCLYSVLVAIFGGWLAKERLTIEQKYPSGTQLDSTSPPGLVVLSMTLSVISNISSPFQFLTSDNLQSCTDRSPSGETKQCQKRKKTNTFYVRLLLLCKAFILNCLPKPSPRQSVGTRGGLATGECAKSCGSSLRWHVQDIEYEHVLRPKTSSKVSSKAICWKRGKSRWSHWQTICLQVDGCGQAALQVDFMK